MYRFSRWRKTPVLYDIMPLLPHVEVLGVVNTNMQAMVAHAGDRPLSQFVKFGFSLTLSNE